VFVELIEQLRCPRDHEEAHLVASADRTEDRHIVEGTLGCAVCGAEFRIARGEAWFDDAAPGAAAAGRGGDAETAMRLAAFLELTDARGFALLLGTWALHADQLQRLADTALVLVNPPQGLLPDAAAVIHAAGALPFAAGAARAAALDGEQPPALIASAVRAVRTAGRLVGPTTLPLPSGVRELVRDDRVWVAEKSAAPDQPAPRLVSLKRA
jgi:hypothetical protein